MPGPVGIPHPPNPILAQRQSGRGDHWEQQRPLLHTIVALAETVRLVISSVKVIEVISIFRIESKMSVMWARSARLPGPIMLRPKSSGCDFKLTCLSTGPELL